MQLKAEPSPSSFIDQCVRGYALLEDIDDYIDQWHEGGTGLPLYAFLGMTQQEYSAWLVEDDLLPYVVKARREQAAFQDVLREVVQQEYFYALAARSQGGEKITRLMQWLKKEGILQ